MRVFTIGHGTRPVEELVACLREANVKTLVDVRRFPASRRNPQFNRDALAETLEADGFEYRHAVELGGRRTGEPGEERFGVAQVGGVEALGEPGVDGGEEVAGLVQLAAIGPEAGEGSGGTQLEGLGALVAGDIKGGEEVRLGRLALAGGQSHLTQDT